MKTMKAEEGRESYASRSLANFGRWRAGEELDETRRFDSQRKRVSVLVCASQKDVHHERIGAVLIAL